MSVVIPMTTSLFANLFKVFVCQMESGAFAVEKLVRLGMQCQFAVNSRITDVLVHARHVTEKSILKPS